MTLIHQDQSYDEDAVCATKNCGNLRRKFVAIATMVKMIFFFRRTIIDIATMELSLKKKITRDMVLPYYIEIWYTILQCNMELPYYIVIWNYHITL